MGIDYKGLISIHGLFKLCELVLIIITFLLAKVGSGLEQGELTFGNSEDQWLGHLTTAAWLIINPIIIIGIILDTPMSWTLDSLFSIVGAFLYIASGSVAIDYWSLSQSFSSSENANAGFAMGSFCIITGLVMMMDATFLILKYGRRTK